MISLTITSSNKRKPGRYLCREQVLSDSSTFLSRCFRQRIFAACLRARLPSKSILSKCVLLRNCCSSRNTFSMLFFFVKTRTKMPYRFIEQKHILSHFIQDDHELEIFLTHRAIMSYVYLSEPKSIHNGNYGYNRNGYNENYCVSMYIFISNILTYETLLY